MASQGEVSRQLRRIVICKFREPLHSLRTEGRRLSADRRFARLFDARHSSIERGDQLVEDTREILVAQRHPVGPLREFSRRPTFQTSPHAAHRQ